MSTTLPEDDQSPGESAAAVPAGSGVGPSYEDFFSYHLALLVKLTERTTAERFHASAGLTLSEGRAITIVGAHQPIRVQDIAERSSLACCCSRCRRSPRKR